VRKRGSQSCPAGMTTEKEKPRGPPVTPTGEVLTNERRTPMPQTVPPGERPEALAQFPKEQYPWPQRGKVCCPACSPASIQIWPHPAYPGGPDLLWYQGGVPKGTSLAAAPTRLLQPWRLGVGCAWRGACRTGLRVPVLPANEPHLSPSPCPVQSHVVTS
jgi:hypothetical protein